MDKPYLTRINPVSYTTIYYFKNDTSRVTFETVMSLCYGWNWQLYIMIDVFRVINYNHDHVYSTGHCLTLIRYDYSNVYRQQGRVFTEKYRFNLMPKLKTRPKQMLGSLQFGSTALFLFWQICFSRKKREI